jgi:hypothetical protein
MERGNEMKHQIDIAVQEMATLAESHEATANDENGIVRAVVARYLPNRPDAQFSAWFLVCCELADREAKRAGYKNEVERAYTVSKLIRDHNTNTASHYTR